MLITNGKLIPWGSEYQVIPEGLGLLIRDGVIQKIAPQNELIKDYPDEEILDAGGQYVMPGNICAHTHFYGAFSRGLGIPGEPASTFTEILEKLWWNLDKALDEDGVRYSALVCLVDAIKHGTTTLIDHHASPNAIDGSLDIIAETINQAGLRHPCVTRSPIEMELKNRSKVCRKPALLSASRIGTRRMRCYEAFLAHASLTLSDETLSRAEELCPAGIGFHIHAAEGMADQVFSLETSGKRVVHRLDQFGILRPESILAHGVHLDQGEIERLAETQTWLTHQPRSNMNNAVGVAPIEDMLDAGMRVGMGNDGFSNTMWLEWKEAYLLHKLYHRDPRRMGGYTVTRIAVDNNAALVTELFDGLQVGQISEGAAAD